MSTNPSAASPRLAEFESLYQKHNREVWAIAYSRWLDADAAMDIVQEAFLRLWKQWDQGETIQNPRAWLMRVAKNLSEDYQKSAFRKNGTTPTIMMNGVHSKELQPLDQLVRLETFSKLRSLLEQMPETDRDILTFKYALEYDTQQIADILNINATAVHMRLSRARQRLADRVRPGEEI